jgi:chromosome segregation ATPase
MSDQIHSEPQKKSCLERAFIFLIRLLFAFIVGIAIGVGIYFGVQLLYNEYQSLTQEYDSRISTLESSQSESNQQMIDRLSGFQTRLETLEIQGDTQKNIIADLESKLDSYDEFRSYQATVVAGQQETITILQDTILALQDEFSTVQTDLDSLESSLSGFQEDLLAIETLSNSLEDSVNENQAAIETINQTLMVMDARMLELEYKMVFLEAMEFLTRARLNLVQGNLTLAKSDIETTRTLLVVLQEQLPHLQAAYVGEIISAADEILTFLPGAPLTAADKLESVWQMLAAGLPVESEENIETPLDSTPSPTPMVTPTPTP